VAGSNDQAILVDTVAAARAVGRPPATIRNWAFRGLIRSCGKDGSRRQLYDLTDIYRTAGRLQRKEKTP
jgi:hypothetical protein